MLDHHRAGLTRQWAVTEQGIWFVLEETSKGPSIEFYSFSTRRIKIVATLEKSLPGISGLDVSPDRRRLLWTQLDQVTSDITLAENFR